MVIAQGGEPSLSPEGWLDFVDRANRARLRVTAIEIDEHRSACDLYAFGGELRRK